MTGNYYSDKLNSTKLFQVYDTNNPRIIQYLQSEIDFARKHIEPTDEVLECGCGYGRILAQLSPFAKTLTGFDISEESILWGRKYLEQAENVHLLTMDANHIDLPNKFDVVLCLQNGLSAMKVDAQNFIIRILGLLKPHGKALYSTYSSLFWEHRLAWFQEQADKGLLGEIDYEKTADGLIVCNDGFIAKTFSEEDLHKLGGISGFPYKVQTVDDSSVFLVISKSNDL